MVSSEVQLPKTKEELSYFALCYSNSVDPVLQEKFNNDPRTVYNWVLETLKNHPEYVQWAKGRANNFTSQLLSYIVIINGARAVSIKIGSGSGHVIGSQLRNMKCKQLDDIEFQHHW